MLRKDWNRILDDYLITGEMCSEEYERMNEAEQEFIQELKKAFKRIKANENKNLYQQEQE